ncbi:MAG: hypothetical protein PHV34_06490 [Verrucomicrobiae bacterium]|nr:hypothetical protein [Verrucomicrobiae bacterium]
MDSEPILTVVSVPKPFAGRMNLIQRNALATWKMPGPSVEIILCGDERGTAETAAEFGVAHCPLARRNEFGTPYLRDAFAAGRERGRGRLMCYINADILVTGAFFEAVCGIERQAERFLVVGECMNLDLPEDWRVAGGGWEKEARQLVAERGVRRGVQSLDFFVFEKDFYMDLPDFLLGRYWFDNWLVWNARKSGATVVDLSASVLMIHQNHNYSHVAGGFAGGQFQEENRRNWAAAGKGFRVYTTQEATHRWLDGILAPQLGGRLLLGYYRRRMERFFARVKHYSQRIVFYSRNPRAVINKIRYGHP